MITRERVRRAADASGRGSNRRRFGGEREYRHNGNAEFGFGAGGRLDQVWDFHDPPPATVLYGLLTAEDAAELVRRRERFALASRRSSLPMIEPARVLCPDCRRAWWIERQARKAVAPC